MKITALLGLALLGLTHLASASPADDTAAASKEIRTALNQWMQAANKQDWNTALQLWAPDLVGWYASDNIDTYAMESENAAHPKPSDTSYSLLKINEIMVEGSLAVVRDTWSRRITQADGRRPLYRVRRYEIWRRQPDKHWKISRYIESPPAPVPETPARIGSLFPIDRSAKTG
jgi:ketosteroid isomerase-like protein